ncbi:MAG: hypothetical protein NTY47_03795 [Candidatus Omnitrophica bacterium]|nr:hypothetical protein [Candidatus Omnitrophota bacterium]
MVKKEISVFLFTGADSASKDAQIKELKRKFFNEKLEQFNCDTFYAKDLELTELQEKILSLPVNSEKRVIVVRQAQNLKPNIKDFIISFIKHDPYRTILVLDMERSDKRDEFIKQLLPIAKKVTFEEPEIINTFTLSRQIELKRMDQALKLLNRLLEEGEKPERILGGLRHTWERNTAALPERKKRLKLLLSCDLDIKTSRMKTAFALEKLVVSLCSLR